MQNLAASGPLPVTGQVCIKVILFIGLCRRFRICFVPKESQNGRSGFAHRKFRKRGESYALVASLMNVRDPNLAVTMMKSLGKSLLNAGFPMVESRIFPV